MPEDLIDRPSVPPPNTQCQWFALCDNAATVYVKHPVLDPVPTCDRCARLASR